MGIKSCIFLKDGKPAFKKLPPSQNGWIVDIGAIQHLWRTLRSAGFHCLETRSLNQDPLENTFGVIRLHCGSNNTTVGHFVDALKDSIINNLAYAGLRNANCKDDDTEVLDNLHSLLKESSASRPNPSTSHGREPIHDGLGGSCIAEEVQREVNDVDMGLFSVAYVNGFIVRHLLRPVRCDDCKACLTFPVMMSTNAFIYCKEYKDLSF
jgi:hypothetical protein